MNALVRLATRRPPVTSLNDVHRMAGCEFPPDMLASTEVGRVVVDALDAERLLKEAAA